MTPDMEQGGALPDAAPWTHNSDPSRDEHSAPTLVVLPTQWAHWPQADELEAGDDAPAIATNRARLARIAQWEDEPLDPEDDLAELLADYPAELTRLRAEQDRIRRDPTYRATAVAGEKLRRLLLVTADGPLGYDRDVAAEFFDVHVCTCEPPGEADPNDPTSSRRYFANGSPVYGRHLDAARCRWCLLRDALADEPAAGGAA